MLWLAFDVINMYVHAVQANKLEITCILTRLTIMNWPHLNKRIMCNNEKRRRNHQSLGYDYKSNALGKHIDGIGYKLHFPSTTVDCCILCSRMTSMLDPYVLCVCVCVQHSCFTALTHRFGYKHGILRHKNRCQSHIFLVKPIK